MKPYLESVWNVTLDRPPQEWIVAIVIALFLALALAGANAALRRWVKVTDESVPLVGLAVIAIFSGMVIAGMHIELNNKGIGRQPSPGAGPPPGGGQGGGAGGGGRGYGGMGRMNRLATHVFENADADHDGFLSIDEAANAAAKFVHDTEAARKGKLDQPTLVEIIRDSTGGGGGGGAPASGSPPAAVGGSPEATKPATKPAVPPPS